MTAAINAICVDVEEYYHAHRARPVPRARWAALPRRAAHGTRLLMDLVEAAGRRATFFVLGTVARRDPGLVREIAARGHELACHGDEHERVDAMVPASFRAAVRSARDALEQAGGIRVLGFRAPSWSLTPEARWAWGLLREEGFAYDASVVPLRRLRHLRGWPDAAPGPWRTPEGLWEFPAPVLRVAGLVYPFSLATILRVAPVGLTRFAVRRHLARTGRPAMLNVHPADVDPAVASLPGAGWLDRVGAASLPRRLARLLRAFPFAPVCRVLDLAGAAEAAA